MEIKPVHPVLKPLIKFYWIIRSDKSVEMDYTLIPTNSCDLILNFSGSSFYNWGGDFFGAEKYHFSGIRKQHIRVKQHGEVNMIGIAFHPAGFYPFMKLPLHECVDKIIDLKSVIGKKRDIFNPLQERCEPKLRIEKLEEILLHLLTSYGNMKNSIGEIVTKMHDPFGGKIPEICDQLGVSQRTLERNFKTQVGVTPKTFFRLTRFQRALAAIKRGECDNLTSLAYDMGYFDQNHFIKDFKLYTGTVPTRLDSVQFIDDII